MKRSLLFAALAAIAITAHAEYPPEAPPAVPCVESGFVDVRGNTELCEAVTWMRNEGITFGVSENRYGPNLPITRGQVALFLYRAMLDTKNKDIYRSVKP